MDMCLLLGGCMAGRYSALVDDVLHPALASMIILTARGELVARQNVMALILATGFKTLSCTR